MTRLGEVEWVRLSSSFPAYPSTCASAETLCGGRGGVAVVRAAYYELKQAYEATADQHVRNQVLVQLSKLSLACRRLVEECSGGSVAWLPRAAPRWVAFRGTIGAGGGVEWLSRPGTLGQTVRDVSEQIQFSATTHADARAAVVVAFVKQIGRQPTLREAQYAQASALGESGYGQGWGNVCGGAGSGCNNVGAVQTSGTPPDCPSYAFPCVDTHEDGTPYDACFRCYPTLTDGFEDFIHQLYVSHDRVKVLQAAAGGITQYSKTLRESGYFQLKLPKYIESMQYNLGRITKALGEPMPPLDQAPGAGGGTPGSYFSSTGFLVPVLAVVGLGLAVTYPVWKNMTWGKLLT